LTQREIWSYSARRGEGEEDQE